jgi:hypothetical protein
MLIGKWKWEVENEISTAKSQRQVEVESVEAAGGKCYEKWKVHL